MQGQTVRIVSQAVRYIEEHLHEKIDLDMVASALHYSKYHLHRIFTKTVGLTIHDYAKRRQLTEAAEFRETENFYPLQLEIYLKEEPVKMDLAKDNIEFAAPADVDDWMELVSLTIDGYPCLDKEAYITNLHQYIADQKALILRDNDMAIGVMGFSPDTSSIDFLAVHPQYRHLGITKLFLDKLAEELLYGKEITLTTYRAGDKADTGWREEYRRLGFEERELLVEYGYPTQRFVLPPKDKEKTLFVDTSIPKGHWRERGNKE